MCVRRSRPIHILKDVHLKVAQLRVPGETIPLSRHHIELAEYVHPRGEDIPLAAVLNIRR